MITQLEIKGFRGFGELSLSPLRRVTLLSGKNNTGKTGILEALYLAMAPVENVSQQMPNLFRQGGEHGKVEYWQWLVDRRFSNSAAHIFTEIDGGERLKTYFGRTRDAMPSDVPQIIHWHSGFLHGHKKRGAGVAAISTFPTTQKEDAAEFSALVRKNRRGRVEKLLRHIDPRLTDVQLIADEQGRPSIHVGLEGVPDMMPLNFLGQGFARLLRIYSKILAEDAKLVLIDEIENGVHHSVLRTVWEGLALAARELDVQIVATTHSWECILAAHHVFEAQPEYDLSLLRLERHGEAVRAIPVGPEGIETACELELEVR